MAEREQGSIPSTVRYFEDFHVGQRDDLGSVVVTGADIVAFARQFDPQPFHVDPQAARASAFGGLVASGWHTASLFMRLYVERVLAHAASVLSPGVDELRWLRPVRPGDTLSARATVLACTPSRTRPDRGTVRILGEMTNHRGELVLRLRSAIVFQRRPAAHSPRAVGGSY